MKKNSKFFLICLIAAIFSIFAVGCSAKESQSTSSSSNSSSSKSSNDKQITIGFSVGMNMVKHWNLEVKGAEMAAKDNGAKLIWKSADLNQQSQVADIENMTQSGVKALIVAPVDSQGIVPTVNEVKGKNIPVFTSDIGVSGTDVQAHVSSDNVKIGEMAADELAKLMGEKGDIGVITWTTVSATKDREKGFLEGLKKYPNIHVVASQDSGGDRNQALSVTENMIQKHPKLDGIFGVNASAAMGAYGATTAANMKLPIMGVDSDEDLLKAIKSGGNLKATIAQNPYEMGYTVVKTALAALKGEKVEPKIAIPAELVTKDNVDKILERDNGFLAKK
ncbi:sugar ABC transporter substrate-binding protein [Paenibacillus sp. BSR1-1]|uniref:sugar ABC transporter substrate-binding protein n=1 Tax=Paenibacillus sp. BSR1-1 TaxID=3020845 RepID=UPI0025B1F6AC|nr:sugar ABC transporter substrate-binding protein [Paenibacillus sp. BSR1-1]MDN3019405.1 sugar ABC transporter substrate-binding protein [Paenibacillus sp. BSR1-1]